MRCLLLTTIAVGALCACGPDQPSWAVSRQHIEGGSPSEHSGVVQLSVDRPRQACSAVLIAPYLVLTARHCVSPRVTPEGGGVRCGFTPFLDRADDASLLLSSGATTSSAQPLPAVSEVVFAPGTADFCDNDLVLLVLAEDVPANQATPLEPSLDAPVLRAQPYTAVGYGAVNDAAVGSGVRRERGALPVFCVGGECGVPDVGPREWQGETAICVGDSGGPALDSSLQVIGIASRSAYQCSSPVYASVGAHAAWLRAEAVRVAQARGLTPVRWASPPPEFPPPDTDVVSRPTGCSSTGCPTLWPMGWLCGLCVALRRPRLRRERT